MTSSARPNRIYLDIETIPSQLPGAEEAARSRVSAPSNYKDEAKIAAYVAEKGAEAWRKTSLDGSYGEVLSIAWSNDDDGVFQVSRTYADGKGLPLANNEGAVLQEFWDMVDRQFGPNPTWVGHYVARFDLRFLYHRSVINGVIPSRVISADVSPYSPFIADTSYMWTGERNAGIKLDELARILGLPDPKDLMDGGEVWDAVAGGHLTAVLEYNKGDVETVRAIYDRLMHFSPAEPDLPI